MPQPITYIAPSSWAGYLINGDSSSMEPDEKRAVDLWLQSIAHGWPSSCEEAGFRRRHDAWHFFPFQADCHLYTFLVDKSDPLPCGVTLKKKR